MAIIISYEANILILILFSIGEPMKNDESDSRPMRKSADWMVLLDDRILELMREDEDGILSPSEIADDRRITYGRTYVAKRLRRLEDDGFVQRYGHGVYRITEKGEAYLDEEYDAIDDRWIGEEDPSDEQDGPTAGEEPGNS